MIALRPDQWRLLNLIYRGDVVAGSNAAAVLARVDVATADLCALVRARLVRIHMCGVDVDPDAIEADPGTLSAYDIRTLPTAAGVNWVVSNPENQVLVWLAGGHRGRTTIDDLKVNTDIEMAGDLSAMRDAGLIDILHENGRPVGRLRLKLSHSGHLRVNVTAKGRRLAGLD
jgi:hypothetical protein